MRLFTFALLWSFSLLSVMSQVEERAFLLDTFEKGKVTYTKGGTSSSNFNYDILNEELLFVGDNSEYLKLANPSIVATVDIGERHFEHIKNGLLYERIEVEGGFLYIRWKSKVISEGSTTLYGMKGTAAATRSISKTSTSQGTFDFEVVDNLKLIPDNKFYLKIKDKFKQFDSFKSLAKLFKEKKDEIEKYVETEKLKFENIEDIKKAVSFCLKED